MAHKWILEYQLQVTKKIVKKPFWKEVLIQAVASMLSVVFLFVLYLVLILMFAGQDKAIETLKKIFLT